MMPGERWLFSLDEGIKCAISDGSGLLLAWAFWDWWWQFACVFLFAGIGSTLRLLIFVLLGYLIPEDR